MPFATHFIGQSECKKTEHGMRLIPSSNLLISGKEFIEKQIFQLGPILK